MATDIIFGLIGGLGFFLFGMKLMSEALRSVAGEKLKDILQFLTKTPLLGIIIGTLVTLLIQSSSATSVMVVGFVNAGLLTLRQAISVIMGANIGTTFTAWLVSFLAIFKITNYALPAVGIGFAMTILGKSRTIKYWGQVILGFGILFMGLAIMKEVFQPLKESGAMKELFLKFSDYPILAVLVGTIVTMILQSSSATIAVIQLLAFNGVISFEASIPLILGDNIGTTITAQIAAINANTTAKRAAMAHLLFNVIGVSYMLILVYTGIYQRFIEFIVPGEITKNSIMLHIAVAHSAFNIFNTFVVFLPLLSLLEKAAIKLVPQREGFIDFTPRYLEKHLLNTPPIAINQAIKETLRMMELAKKALDEAVIGFFEDNRKILDNVIQKEETIDNLQKEITAYLVQLTQKSLNREESQTIPVLLHSVNDIERMGDHAENIVELAHRKIDQKAALTHWAIDELHLITDEVNHMFDELTKALENNDKTLAKRALKREERVNQLQLELKQNHVERLNEGKCKLISGLLFIDFVDNIEKIGDHLANVAESVMNNLRWKLNSINQQ
ncbi:MAG TPA: Na/Pi cotransporter family protein [Nitrospinota bacterium]|nr:Na/Pi cotransporter family protein [Nitrospinota bacterium]